MNHSNEPNQSNKLKKEKTFLISIIILYCIISLISGISFLINNEQAKGIIDLTLTALLSISIFKINRNIFFKIIILIFLIVHELIFLSVLISFLLFFSDRFPYKTANYFFIEYDSHLRMGYFYYFVLLFIFTYSLYITLRIKIEKK
ncbi:hypothetical protein CLV96_3982 [Leptospira meyeri]|uniref:Uncharacterized protein n=1 Tax=Leptospira meyeri TaxID=29508 RepID=A0A4R8MMB3_LEPME|nr:hypothetical protein LEP1GSC017_0460 [Leptospira meyeri serovar Hardjo str. Went 5]TDY66129.1 hypothetical protein CLV96_3982 [Leptospira meyeri]